MSDGAFPDRLTQLKNRWDADPTSRVFLQLAEEYRHQGRVKEALAVLDRGLKEHPGYLSALVAKGRCHLELGEPEPARAVLERVVKQDATQMVANKLLVRAYLETGEPDRARERLDLYSLLNDSDPEIEELRRRLRAMEQPPQPPPTSDRPFPESAPPPAPSRREAAVTPSREDIFDLGFPAPAPRGGGALAPDEPFADLWKPPAAPAPAPGTPPPAAMASPLPVTAVAVAEAEGEPEAEDVVFPGLASRESRSRYLRSLAAEGLFAFDLTAGDATAPAPELVAPAPAVQEIAVPAVPEAAAPAVFEPEPFVAEPAPEPEEAAFSEVSSVETAEPARSLEETHPALEPFVAEPEPAPAAVAGFTWEVLEEAVSPAPAAPVAEAEPAWAAEPEAPVFEIEEQTPWAVEPEPIAPEPPAPEASLPEPSREPAPAAGPVATVTLGELYLRQDHLGEAKRIFEEILRREPDNAAAREGLAQLSSRQRPIAARDLLAGYEPGEEGGEAEVRSRKRFLLNSYLRRLRRGSQSDVS
jgi:tetratricopeptide (TPR) repeat protein